MSQDTERWVVVAQRTYVTIFLIALYAPLVMLVTLSFNNSRIIGFPWEGFTVRWYRQVLDSKALLEAFGNSLLVGAAAAAIATALATGLGLAFRHEFRLKKILFYAIVSPIVLPGIAGGVLLLLFFGLLGVAPKLLTTVLVAHVNWVLPFAFLVLYPRLSRLDSALEDAARDLGATDLEVFTRVIWPSIWPAAAATFLFALSLSFDEFIRTIFVTGGERTIPIHFWILVVEELTPELPAMATTIVLVTVCLSALAHLVLQFSNGGADEKH
jgi:ABC-type spermidine/putrescine transport system permease subunit II